jgi:hypothetical protein
MSEKCFRYDATCIHAYGIKEAQCEKCIQSALAPERMKEQELSL